MITIRLFYARGQHIVLCTCSVFTMFAKYLKKKRNNFTRVCQSPRRYLNRARSVMSCEARDRLGPPIACDRRWSPCCVRRTDGSGNDKPEINPDVNDGENIETENATVAVWPLMTGGAVTTHKCESPRTTGVVCDGRRPPVWSGAA